MLSVRSSEWKAAVSVESESSHPGYSMDPLHHPARAASEGRDHTSRSGSGDVLRCPGPADGSPHRPPDAVHGIVFALPPALLMWAVIIGAGIAVWEAVAAWTP